MSMVTEGTPLGPCCDYRNPPGTDSSAHLDLMTTLYSGLRPSVWRMLYPPTEIKPYAYGINPYPQILSCIGGEGGILCHVYCQP